MSKDVLIKSSSHGKGVFAKKRFGKGEWILNFRGKIYRSHDKPRGLNSQHNHYLQIGEDLFLGPSRSADNFVNHSCHPNAGIKILAKAIQLIAIKNIRVGEEIRFDYSTTMFQDEWEMKCHCDARGCRKVIREFWRLDKRIRDKYIRLRIIPEYVLNGTR
jgi:uncharacterized protein